MFILRTLDVVNAKDMKINVDIRDTNTVVYDADLLQSADSSEIVKLVIKRSDKLLRDVINIIATSLNLNESAIELYYEITNMIKHNNCDKDNYVIAKDLIDIAVPKYHKTDTTYKRVLDNLIVMGIIKYKVGRVDRSLLTINKQYDVSYLVGDTTKYIVIEVTDNDVR